MRKWGVIVTAFYILVVAGLSPGLVAVLADPAHVGWAAMGAWYAQWFLLGWLALLVAGPIMLLLVRVDTVPWVPDRKRHVAISAIATGQALALLLGFAVWSIIMVFTGDKQDDIVAWVVIGLWLGAWLVWTVVLWRSAGWFFDPAHWALRWVIGGSVLELLIAVPSHLIVRQRNECSAPVITAFGVVTGLAILLMSVGPGVFFLYRARMGRPGGRGPDAGTGR